LECELRWSSTRLRVAPGGSPRAPISGLREETIERALLGYDVEAGATVVVRPDRYVGTIESTPGAIASYISRFAFRAEEFCVSRT
jgi:hypothetical protein